MKIISKWVLHLNDIDYLSSEGIVFQDRSGHCGSSCIKMLLNRDHIEFPVEINECNIEQYYMSMYHLKLLLEHFGFRCKGLRFVNIHKLQSYMSENSVTGVVSLINTWKMHPLYPLGCILEKFEKLGIRTQKLNHWVIVKKVTSTHVFLQDPAFGNVRLTLKTFERLWRNYALCSFDS